MQSDRGGDFVDLRKKYTLLWARGLGVRLVPPTVRSVFPIANRKESGGRRAPYSQAKLYRTMFSAPGRRTEAELVKDGGINGGLFGNYR